jgi:hypothetical protein
VFRVLHPAHATRLPDLLGPEFVCDAEVIRDAITARRIFSVMHREALQEVDIIVRDARDYEIEKFERRRRVEVVERWAVRLTVATLLTEFRA